MAGEQESDVVKVDVQALATNLNKMILSNNTSLISMDCCIFPVPSTLSRHNPSAYTPIRFSIGPFHYMKLPFAEATQKIKLKYLHQLISRPWENQQNHNNEEKLTSITKAVTALEEKARKSYSELQGFSATEFVNVSLLDGCFLIELFRKNAYKHQLVENDDPIFSMSYMLQHLYHDLLLVENQIPWLVLDALFEMTKSSAVDSKPLVFLAIDFFANIFSASKPSIEPTLVSKLGRESKHILDLLRNWLVMTSRVERQETQRWRQTIPSATSLKKAGIEILANGTSECILDIYFAKGKMYIPALFIQKPTETVFHNLICLEQCCPNYDPIVTSYAQLMGGLINSPSDMEILIKSGAIRSWFSMEDASNFFNKLHRDAYLKKNYYSSLMHQVDGYYVETRRRWRHPFALLCFVAGTILLILTFLLTLHTIMK